MNFELQIDQTMMNQVKISRLFQMDFAYHCLACDYVWHSFNLIVYQDINLSYHIEWIGLEHFCEKSKVATKNLSVG